eukprot:CAMPEP_0183715182 /NCGR_PEP_ID=MMETSP0737-20130205/9520_1 /TAXON_ID=385413 /ORGANISM="Thalassiosira miniscula, Strain CCMP1093" /LENGTH=733 /DNA_ID=CAMNT_0025944267 /DNA_START=94 /DNA_END=2295 /DNA_ORIENTATION=+
MDPEPSKVMVAKSETWSVASNSIMDTRSEPARYYGRHSEKMSIKTKSSSASVNNNRAQHQNGSIALALATTICNDHNSTRSRADPEETGSSTASTNGGGRSKPKQSFRSSSSSIIDKKISSSNSSRKGRASANSSRNSRGQSHSNSNSNSNKSYRRHNSRDPEESSTGADPVGFDSNQAIVPVAPPPRRRQPHYNYTQQSPLDPPSGSSTSGSSSSTECASNNHCDPPSCFGSMSQESPLYAKVYQPHREQLAVWDEGHRGEEDDSTRASQSILSQSRMETTLSSNPDRRGGSKSSSESSYYSDEDEGESSATPEDTATATDADEEGGELASNVQRALAIRQEVESVGTSTARDSTVRDSTASEGEEEDGEYGDEADDFKDARALVESDYHGGVNSVYEGDDNGAIIPKEDPIHNRYLSSAVDNLQAIVPIDSAIYEAYDHTFVTCPEHLRFRFLFTFLKKNLDKKVMIFFSTTNSVKFHAKLLEHFHVPVITMHGKQGRDKFVHRFFKFSDMDTGILCATDAAGRDLDIPPSVDWVVQFEPPDDPSEYILRVARISCDSDRVGRSLLFLNPGEQGFLKYYHSAAIPVSEFEIPTGKLADVQSNIEYHVNENDRLLNLARDAYGSYLIAYASHGFRDVYNVHDLNKHDVASAFGLVGLPDDDRTMETDTLAESAYIGGAEGGVPTTKTSSAKKTWEKKEKPRTKSWMRGEKSWPHSQIKMHPKFKQHEGEMGY